MPAKNKLGRKLKRTSQAAPRAPVPGPNTAPRIKPARAAALKPAPETEYQISAFRAQIPQEFDRVTRQVGSFARVTRRGTEANAIFVDESVMAGMIREIQELRARLDDALRAGGEPFRLIGSAELTVDPDDVLTASRARQAGLATVKRREF
jgi:hypothetical protein